MGEDRYFLKSLRISVSIEPLGGAAMAAIPFHSTPLQLSSKLHHSFSSHSLFHHSFLMFPWIQFTLCSLHLHPSLPFSPLTSLSLSPTSLSLSLSHPPLFFIPNTVSFLFLMHSSYLRPDHLISILYLLPVIETLLALI